MKIIISPAKKMHVDTDTLQFLELPVFVHKTEEIKNWLRTQSSSDLKRLWGCNDQIAEENFRRLEHMDLYHQLTPALLAYEGIAYQYMAPGVFSQAQWDYVQEHLRILSGFYGILKPLDGVTPYRLEMQAKAAIGGHKNLYDYWGDCLYRQLMTEDFIINLASTEYSKCIEKYIKDKNRFITVVFGEIQNGRVVQKGTMAKMARGEMVRFMAEHSISKIDQLKAFDRLGYLFAPEYSSSQKLVFMK